MIRSNRFFIAAILTFSVISMGTLGYMFIEGWGFLDSIYMTVITLTTVGYAEVHKISPRGQIFTMILICLGIGVIFYTAGSIAQVMVEGRLRELLGRRKLENKINRLKDHYIICGHGRMGGIVCEELASKSIPFVAIEVDPALIQKIEERNYLYLQGSATDEDILMKSGIEKARGLVSVLASDADNVFVTLTARGLNPHLHIVARATEEGAGKKLMKAGAIKVISPYSAGARGIVEALLRPAVCDFMELALHGRSLQFQVEEIPVGDNSSLKDVTLQQSKIREKLDLIVIGIKRSTGEMVFNPSAHTKIMSKDTLIVLGDTQSLKRLEDLCAFTPSEAYSK